MGVVKNYSNGEITIVWKPKVCCHSGNCFNGLPGVFNPANRPWVSITGASSEQIINQVENCPSGALSYFRNNEKQTT